MEKHPSKPTEAGKYNNQYENIQPFTGNAILSTAVGELKKKKSFFSRPYPCSIKYGYEGNRPLGIDAFFNQFYVKRTSLPLYGHDFGKIEVGLKW